MKRVGIAAVVGGVVLFVWGLVSRAYIPWHETRALPDQAAVAEALGDPAVESGIYEFPKAVEPVPDEAGDGENPSEPAGLLVYKAGGAAPMVLKQVVGLVLDVLAAAVAAGLLVMALPALPGFAVRVLFVLLIGLFAVFVANLMHWNYMYHPFRYTLEMAGDALVGALLLGVALAIIIKPVSAEDVIEDTVDTEVSEGA
jgi:hypothetical protein